MKRVIKWLLVGAVAMILPMMVVTPAHAVDNHLVGTKAVWINGHAFKGAGGHDPTAGTYDPVIKQTIYTKPFRPGQYDTAVIHLDTANCFGCSSSGSSTWYTNSAARFTIEEKSPTGNWSPISASHGGITSFANSSVDVTLQDLPYNWQVRITAKISWRPKIELAYPDEVWIEGHEYDYQDGVLVGTPDGDPGPEGWGYGWSALYPFTD